MHTIADIQRELLTADEVAAVIGMSPWGVRHLHRKHRLRGVVQAGKLFWLRKHVERYVSGLGATVETSHSTVAGGL